MPTTLLKIWPQFLILDPHVRSCLKCLESLKKLLPLMTYILVPGHSTVLPHTANISTRLTRGIKLNLPLISASMDTVTEARLAISPRAGRWSWFYS